mmetsp:Transcript_4742/g.12458  ORF Transcript_4742/g.12458 Transcript_4742/m.12458 type:complete len:141 (+) Transcript_4742:68-490(+)
MESRKRARKGRQNGGVLSAAAHEELEEHVAEEYGAHHRGNHANGLASSRSSRRQPRVDLSKLEIPSLRKYRHAYNLGGMFDSKEDLVPAVARHFAAQTVDEDDTLLNFAFSLKKQYVARHGGTAMSNKLVAKTGKTKGRK